jgi:hypothetical protein
MRYSHSMRSLRIAVRILAAVVGISHFAPLVRADAAEEVQAALLKLQSTTYRQRDEVGVMASIPGALVAPTVTEHAQGRTRLVSEIKHPSFGTIRTERITVGSQAAVRTIAPALLTKLEQAKRKLTVSSAKSLLQQIISAASAAQTGGLSAASWIVEATRAATTLKTTADARVALDRAMEGFQSWQRVEEDLDTDIPQPLGTERFGSDRDVMKAEKITTSSGGVISYRRKPTDTMPGMDFYTVLHVDATTGLPVAEENFMNGQRLMRSEFYDVGAAIEIEIPECLR